MKIAIVGSSNLTDQEMDRATSIISEIIAKHPKDIIVTGDARGIDYITETICKAWQHPHRVYESVFKRWENNGFRDRNLRIVSNSDYVYSLATPIKNKPCYHCSNPNHERTGGCWTLKEALKSGKKGEVIII